jgi:hypothetical protein
VFGVYFRYRYRRDSRCLRRRRGVCPGWKPLVRPWWQWRYFEGASKRAEPGRAACDERSWSRSAGRCSAAPSGRSMSSRPRNGAVPTPAGRDTNLMATGASCCSTEVCRRLVCGLPYRPRWMRDQGALENQHRESLSIRFSYGRVLVSSRRLGEGAGIRAAFLFVAKRNYTRWMGTSRAQDLRAGTATARMVSESPFHVENEMQSAESVGLISEKCPVLC